jgi:serine/threonine protein phosphatase PrpC
VAVPPRPKKLAYDFPLFITQHEEGQPSQRFAVGCAKMIGVGRKNEDTLMVRGCLRGKPDEDYFGLFDGHGGKQSSRYAADNFHKILAEQLDVDSRDPAAALRRTFAEVNQRMLQHFYATRTKDECGCTAIVALVVGDMLYVAGAGDARVVYCHGEHVIRATTDHKPNLEVEARRIRALGGMVRPDTEAAKQYRVCKLFSNGGFGGLAISRALGDFSWAPQITDEPTITTYKLPLPEASSTSSSKTNSSDEKKEKEIENDNEGIAEEEREGAFLILGCDGVWDVLSDEEAASIVRREVDVLKASVRIRDHAYYLGSGDDIAVIVVRFS